MNQTSDKNQTKPSLLDKVKDKFQANPKTTKDMVAIVDAASANEVIDKDARRIIEGALEVSAMQVRDIMIPRTQMTILNIEDSLESIIDKIIETGHSRYPVIGENIDEVIGILLAKDLLSLAFNKDEEQSIKALLRPIVFVPESKRLNVLLKQFREDKDHMALVIDEYGSIAGLITLEDVLEEIVGEIEDEHDLEEDQQIRKLSNNSYFIDALTTIDTFNEYFSTEISDEEFDTIGGFIVNQFGHLPKRDEEIEFAGYSFCVKRADSRRLHTFSMSPIENDTDTED